MIPYIEGKIWSPRTMQNACYTSKYTQSNTNIFLKIHVAIHIFSFTNNFKLFLEKLVYRFIPRLLKIIINFLAVSFSYVHCTYLESLMYYIPGTFLDTIL